MYVTIEQTTSRCTVSCLTTWHLQLSVCWHIVSLSILHTHTLVYTNTHTSVSCFTSSQSCDKIITKMCLYRKPYCSLVSLETMRATHDHKTKAHWFEPAIQTVTPTNNSQHDLDHKPQSSWISTNKVITNYKQTQQQNNETWYSYSSLVPRL